jgi:hypothetical protein
MRLSIERDQVVGIVAVLILYVGLSLALQSGILGRVVPLLAEVIGGLPIR